MTSEGFPQWSVDLDKYRKTPTELFNLMDSGGETGAAHNIFGYRAMNRRVSASQLDIKCVVLIFLDSATVHAIGTCIAQ